MFRCIGAVPGGTIREILPVPPSLGFRIQDGLGVSFVTIIELRLYSLPVSVHNKDIGGGESLSNYGKIMERLFFLERILVNRLSVLKWFLLRDYSRPLSWRATFSVLLTSNFAMRFIATLTTFQSW